MSAAIALDRRVPPPGGAVRPFRFPAFERIELGPTLELIAARSAAAPLVYLELITPGGAQFDPAGRAGLAALTGAMLDEGTRHHTSLEIAARTERLGGYLSTGTDWDVASLSCGLLSAHLETGLELIAEVITEPTFPEAELARLRARTLSEIQRRRAMPAFLASRQFSRALYGDGAYGQPILGSAASIEALTAEEIEGFYRDHLLAAPMTLIATGDFDPERLGKLARPLLQTLPAAPAVPQPAIESPEGEGLRIYVVDRPGAAQTELRVGHVGIARSDPDYTALTVMNSLLGGKFTSRLVLNLREKHGITYGIRSGFGPRLGRGPFAVSSAVANDAVGRAVAEIRREIERLRAEPVTEDELRETHNYILGVFPYTVETLEGVAHRLREIAIHSLPDDHWDRYPDSVRRVDVEEVRRVALAHLRPDHLAVVAVGPEAELRPQLESFATVLTWRPADRLEPV